MSYILWRRLLLKTVASRQAKPPFRWPLLLPSATRMALAICWQCAFYGSQVAEVAVFVTKKFLPNLNFRKFLPQEFWGRYAHNYKTLRLYLTINSWIITW